MRAVVLVEGSSDEAAVRALAGRQGVDVDVVVCGGAGGFGRAAAAADAAIVIGLCDEREEAGVRRAGIDELFVCRADLEEELIRALGADEVVDVIRREGEIRMFRSFQDQVAQRERPLGVQLHRFLGTKSGRKIRYGRLLVEALPPTAVPDPLAGLLDRLELSR